MPVNIPLSYLLSYKLTVHQSVLFIVVLLLKCVMMIESLKMMIMIMIRVLAMVGEFPSGSLVQIGCAARHK